MRAHATSFYVKLGAACFVIGGCMEFFMIKTGFYDVVKRTESERWEEHREEREARARAFKASAIEAYRRRGLEPPPVLQQDEH